MNGVFYTESRWDGKSDSNEPFQKWFTHQSWINSNNMKTVSHWKACTTCFEDEGNVIPLKFRIWGSKFRFSNAGHKFITTQIKMVLNGTIFPIRNWNMKMIKNTKLFSLTLLSIRLLPRREKFGKSLIVKCS